MLQSIELHHVLFIDIETVPAYPDYEDMPDHFQALWDQKAERLKKSETETSDQIYAKAGIYAEFGKIICISAGYFYNREFRIKSFYSDDEKLLLTEFNELLNSHFSSRQHLLCAHNGKEFDYPYIARRMLINDLQLPLILNIAGKKPWEIPHLDTMELWKFGDYKHYTSLALLAAIFGIKTPKDDINGADVARVYWEDHDMERIVHYCQKDVLTVAQLFLKYQSKPLLNDNQIVIIP
ncbi:MAG: 3'-5' exonuclease [Bacteroidetes bacterium]|nr:3'-5' exonuclease [Bacteroidota bacterium]